MPSPFSQCVRYRAPTLNVLSTILLALAMSTDAFAAAVVKGGPAPPALARGGRAGLIFGSIEAMTPIVGWALGSPATSHVEAWDHWIAFGLLGVLGVKMISEGLQAADQPAEERPTRHPFWMLALTGLATSIDAMAVGVGLAFLDVAILPLAATIGFTTFLLVTAGVLLGRVLGVVVGKRAEIFGGIVLIGIGVAILVEHLGLV
jgi:putative Mn2+ efflux pump MntP